MAKIANLAIEAFPVSPIPKDITKRREYMQKLSEEISDIWNKLDDKFYEYPENLEEKVIAYVKKNLNEFE